MEPSTSTRGWFGKIGASPFNIVMSKNVIPTVADPETYRRILTESLALAGDGALAIFGYGSLIWRPGFRVRKKLAAQVYGYTRRLAVHSRHYRGTARRPGLVFGLDAGGSCNGVVLFPAAGNRRVIENLFRREMFANAYHPRFVRAQLSDGKEVRALTFVVRRVGEHYAPPMPLAKAATIIRGAKGFGGGNADYIRNTYTALQQYDIHCPQLAQLCALL